MLDRRLGPKDTKMNNKSSSHPEKVIRACPITRSNVRTMWSDQKQSHLTVLRDSVLFPILLPSLSRIDCA